VQLQDCVSQAARNVRNYMSSARNAISPSTAATASAATAAVEVSSHRLNSLLKWVNKSLGLLNGPIRDIPSDMAHAHATAAIILNGSFKGEGEEINSPATRRLST
jgi:hypothetical protein